jgi:hypothetical protein
MSVAETKPPENITPPLGVKGSKELLMETIKEKGGMTFDEALEFAERDGVWFGPEKNIFDFITLQQSLGFLEFDKSEHKYVVCEPRKTPHYD